MTDALTVDTHLDRMWHALMQEHYPILSTPIASTPKRRYMSTWRARPPLASPAVQALGGPRAAQRSLSRVQSLESPILVGAAIGKAVVLSGRNQTPARRAR